LSQAAPVGTWWRWICHPRRASSGLVTRSTEYGKATRTVFESLILIESQR
jgi:hypothetical protein